MEPTRRSEIPASTAVKTQVKVCRNTTSQNKKQTFLKGIKPQKRI